jgi:nucleotide-binding universal stress UspA family protein
MLKHILVATDFGEPSDVAVELAIEIANAMHAELTLVHAYEIPAYVYGGVGFSPADLVTPVIDASRDALKVAISRVRAQVPNATSVLRNGNPATEIVSVAELVHADLIVVGTHGRRGLSHALLGSVAERLVRSSPVPVLVARAHGLQEHAAIAPAHVEP